MESLLQGIPNASIYIDDILVAGKSYQEHIDTSETVLARLHDAGLRLKKEKCCFTMSSVTYLGYRVDKDRIHPITEKVRAIKDAPQPKNVTAECISRSLVILQLIFAPSSISISSTI
uniref:Reverse transcriptase domain-containing protein n=1 Tax=Amphimedon queenslandica TaxID=400682 RepID=A0A1X7T0I6_AMPQE